MERKKMTKFPKGFFQQPRPTITASEALKDIIPFDWSNSKKKKTNTKLAKTKVKKTSHSYD